MTDKSSSTTFAPVEGKRVLFVRAGGWTRWVDTFAAFLARENCEVAAIVFKSEPGMDVPPSKGVRIIYEETSRFSGGKAIATFRRAHRLFCLLRKSPYDVIVVVDSWSIPVFWLATFGRFQWRRTKTVYLTFEFLDPVLHRGIRCWLEQSICRSCSLAVNVDRVRARVQQMLYNLPKCPMYIRNSLSREFSIPLRSEERRREMAGKNVPPRIKIVLMPTVATDERLGLQAIQALERLPNEYRYACIAGTGEYFEKCKEQVAKLGVSDRVTFLPRMPFNQLMEYIASADIGLIIHDGRQSLGNFLSNPMRLSQFAICGVPFVTGNFATLGGDVYRYHLGECCDEMNPEDIARAIRVVGDATGSPEARRGAIRTSYLENLAFEVGAVPFAEAVRALGQGTG